MRDTRRRDDTTLQFGELTCHFSVAVPAPAHLLPSACPPEPTTHRTKGNIAKAVYTPGLGLQLHGGPLIYLFYSII